jgi:hypothetical protein
MTGFGAGAAGGMVAGRAVFAGGTLLAVQAGLTLAGPVGWLILGGIFITSVGAGYLIGSSIDNGSQKFSDWLMK